jgi:hypothetical protein
MFLCIVLIRLELICVVMHRYDSTGDSSLDALGFGLGYCSPPSPGYVVWISKQKTCELVCHKCMKTKAKQTQLNRFLTRSKRS